MKELRDLKDLTIHDVQPISDEQTTGRRHGDEAGREDRGAPRALHRVGMDVAPRQHQHVLHVQHRWRPTSPAVHQTRRQP